MQHLLTQSFLVDRPNCRQAEAEGLASLTTPNKRKRVE
jgi:hypothetical protein